MLGNIGECDDELMSQCTAFIAACYGFPGETDMTSLRYKVWTSKMASHKINSAPKLQNLPPTSEAFHQHVRRAHLQAAIWKSALDSDPPNLNPTDYGWTRAHRHKQTGTDRPSRRCTTCSCHSIEDDQMWMFIFTTVFHIKM